MRQGGGGGGYKHVCSSCFARGKSFIYPYSYLDNCRALCHFASFKAFQPVAANRTYAEALSYGKKCNSHIDHDKESEVLITSQKKGNTKCGSTPMIQTKISVTKCFNKIYKHKQLYCVTDSTHCKTMLTWTRCLIPVPEDTDKSKKYAEDFQNNHSTLVPQ